MNNIELKEQLDRIESKLDDFTPMPESALLIATAQIMIESDSKHSL